MICLAGPGGSGTPDLSGNFLFSNDCRLLLAPTSISKIEMQSGAGQHHFESDNTAGICPEVLAAIEEINHGATESYGADEFTGQVRKLVCDLFETNCDIHLVSNGTAANALALAQLCQPFHSVVCHRNAHIQTDECGAPEFFTRGSKLLLVGGGNGKLDLGQVEPTIVRHPEVHAHKPRVISITQATEFGTVYTRDEICAVTDLARRQNMYVHMDGARFANAIATLACSPKEITWKSGVDVLCFGGTKNGAAAAELVIFLKKGLSSEFDFRVKQGGQLISKARFLAAQWIGLLTNDIWLKNARHANAMTRKLAERLRRKSKMDVVLPTEANALFVRLSDRRVQDMNARGWRFYKFIEPDVYRLMCSWATTDSQIDEFVGDLSR